MLVFSHMKFGRHFFKGLKKAKQLNFNVHFIEFVYGNIKPDISELATLKHHFGDTYEYFLYYKTQAMDESLSTKERSLALGIAVHFMCDYFTKFHAKKPYNEMNLINHFIYEIKLHWYIAYQFFIRYFKGNKAIRNLYITKSKDEDRDIEADGELLALLQSYYSVADSVATDYHFAMFGVNALIYEVLGIRPYEVHTKQDSIMPVLDLQEEPVALRRAI